MESDDGLANQHLIDNQFGESSGRSALSHFGRHACQAFEPQARFLGSPRPFGSTTGTACLPNRCFRDCQIYSKDCTNRLNYGENIFYFSLSMSAAVALYEGILYAEACRPLFPLTLCPQSLNKARAMGCHPLGTEASSLQKCSTPCKHRVLALYSLQPLHNHRPLISHHALRR